MDTNSRKRNHYYILPNGERANSMKEARDKMNLGSQGFRALVRKGIVKKIQISSKTTGYEKLNSN